VFALPGNPVSTLVCLSRYVLPALRAAMGQAPSETPRIALTAPSR
jgi:molybdopterin molybdotransferase